MSTTCRNCNQPIDWDKTIREKLNYKGPFNLEKSPHKCMSSSPNSDTVNTATSTTIPQPQQQEQQKQEQQSQQSQAVVYPYSVKIEQDSKGKAKVSIHVYGVDADTTKDEAVRLFVKTQDELKGKGVVVLESTKEEDET
jgi:hypothetical protein